MRATEGGHGLALLWGPTAANAEPFLARTSARTVIVSLEPLAAAACRRAGVAYIDIDSLLDWETRASIEARVRDLLGALADHPLAAAGEYHLRYELTTALCVFHALRALGEPVSSVAGQPGCPSAVVLAAEAAVLGRVASPAPFVPAWAPQPPPADLRGRAAALASRLMAALPPARRVRVLAIPTLKVVPALSAVDGPVLRAAGVGVAEFPGLAYATPARLGIAKRIPVLGPAPPIAPADAVIDEPTPPLDDDPVVDRLLATLARATLAHTAALAVAAERATARFESLKELRAVLLPTTAVGPARALRDWAAARGLEVAVVQHGVYALRRWDGGDRLATRVLAWSPAVAEQVRGWEPPHPSVVPVGLPGLANTGRRTGGARVQRVLVASTGRALGSALGLFGHTRSFLEAVAPGLQSLQADLGVEVRLRLHPEQRRGDYVELLDEVGLRAVIDSAPSFHEALAGSDLLVSAPSSVALEGGALGVPVLLWLGAVPVAIREREFLHPLDADRPGIFADSAEFAALCHEMRAADGAVPAAAEDLGRELARLARPFDPAAFADQLAELGR